MNVYRKLPLSPSSEVSEDASTLGDDGLNFDNGHKVSGTAAAGNKRKTFTTLARHAVLLFCILCTFINVAIVAFVSPNSSLSAASTTLDRTDLISAFRSEDISKLRRPSQFIRFDEIQRPSPPIPRQFDNHPILIAQVDRDRPDHVFGEVTRQYMASPGTITPEDRRVLVTPSISTIVQFRAIDYGMGTCELRLTIPPSLMHGENPGLLDSSQARPLSVYRLNSTRPLSSRALSARTKPDRIAQVAEVLLQREEGTAGLVWHRKFMCEENEILTFELACGTAALGDTCTVEWWQDRQTPNPGKINNS
ncbi:hypothetical protein SCHPADRAFT_887665 [Schizopora paradoxa]|uniref:Ubiquitin 3 binding protein But2 C-terminal domain-containing protein n=1 Tax=Schizopora paradoxa TaxID=27342 RepID=A0A0H2SHP7_9AGAM|nr:hypothetical protein SCHPADRAFT_887665 [Schizopora paradoxa]